MNTIISHRFGARFLLLCFFAAVLGCGKNDRHANKAPIEKTKKPGVRIDGIYASQDSDGKWQYLRFTEQEVWFETSKQPASEVAAWIGGEENRKPK
ncbi:MAG: hypothetical protein IH991_06105 [Planctomycetes bacterium]|nr:hypothetical protein [Planctomycetota bacterium]